MEEQAKKNNKTDNKPEMDLLPLAFLEPVARVMGLGAAKYGRFNYKKGHVNTDLTAAALRHLKQWEAGQDIDPESGQSHLAHVAANMLMLLDQQAEGTSKEGRYQKELTARQGLRPPGVL